MPLKPCVYCGRYVTTAVRTCPYCGRQVTTHVETLWGVGVLILAVSAVGGVIFFAINSLQLHKLVDWIIGIVANIH